MYRMIYASKRSGKSNLEDLHAILEKARRFNEANGLTGMLVHSPEFFMQCIEGDRIAVNQLYHKIAKDPRHEDLLIIEAKDCDLRMFPAWSMGNASMKRDNRRLYLKFFPDGQFNPYRIHTHVAPMFLEYLSQIEDLSA